MKRFSALILVLMSLLFIALPVSASEAFLYTEETSGCSISVPAGWKLEYEDDGVVFLPRSGESAPMRYRFSDLWAELSQAEKKNTPRNAYSQETFTKEDAAELLDVRSSAIKKINLGGTEYYQVIAVTQKGFLFFKTKYTVISLLHVDNGYLHLYQFEGNVNHSLYSPFENMVASASYDGTNSAEETIPETVLPETTEAARTSSDIYEEAVDAYEDGYYANAKSLFESISSYADSKKYLRLIRIRNFGKNTGIGCVYNFNYALTEAEKEEIDEAAEDFYFADTAQVLLCNTDVACYYLGSHNGKTGDWITASNAPTYAYFKLHKDSVGGYYYTRSSNLSKAVSDSVSINDGEVRISITSSNTLVFHFELTAPDCMDVYSYETRNSFFLYRS